MVVVPLQRQPDRYNGDVAVINPDHPTRTNVQPDTSISSRIERWMDGGAVVLTALSLPAPWRPSVNCRWENIVSAACWGLNHSGTRLIPLWRWYRYRRRGVRAARDSLLFNRKGVHSFNKPCPTFLSHPRTIGAFVTWGRRFFGAGRGAAGFASPSAAASRASTTSLRWNTFPRQPARRRPANAYIGIRPFRSTTPAMTATKIDGTAIAKSIRERISKDIAEKQAQNSRYKPSLVIMQVGDRSDSNTYVRMKLKAAEEANISCNLEHYDSSISEIELLRKIEFYNNDPHVHGILVQLPLPEHINEYEVTSAVADEKDVDGFRAQNIGELAKRGGKPRFVPCTPKGVMVLLEESGVDLKGKNAVVLGRSDIAGAPVSYLLKNADATVTVCHSKTQPRLETQPLTSMDRCRYPAFCCISFPKSLA